MIRQAKQTGYILLPVIVVITLIALKHGFPDVDIYGVLDWLYEMFPSRKR